MSNADEVVGRHAASGFSEIGRRELGFSGSRAFTRRVGGSEGLVRRMNQYGKLRGHDGCVNTVSFNPTGDLLVSGSDDMDIILWDWFAKTKKLVYPSGHEENVFHACMFPFRDDCTIVTAAADGQVRVGQLKEGGEVTTKQIGTHDDRVHKLALEPGSPHIFYSCGEDGLVQHFDLRSNSPMKLVTCSSFPNGCNIVRLNAIAIGPQNPNYLTVGGSDQYVRLYDMRNLQLDTSTHSNQPVDTFCPKHLIGGPMAHITGIAYSNAREILVSYNDELVYMFQNNMGLGPNPALAETEFLVKLEQPQVYSGHRNSRTVKGVRFFGPSDEYVVSGSDCGHVFMWKKDGELMRMMLGDRNIVNCIEPHPYFPFLATSGFDKTIKIWTPAANKLLSLPKNAKEIMAANKRGREVETSQSAVPLTSEVIMHVMY